MWLLSAFAIGFVGSFHCAGMCGPIALALPLDKKTALGVFSGRVLYNSGRILTYTFFGIVLGLLGHLISFSGYQRSLSVASGILILLVLLMPFLFKKIDALQFIYNKYIATFKLRFRELFGKRSRKTLFFIGVLNGFLPCGMVYLALAAALATGSLQKSAAFMLLFGLGTIPMMLTLSMLGNFAGPSLRKRINQLSPWVAVTVALILIARGIMAGAGAACH